MSELPRHPRRSLKKTDDRPERVSSLAIVPKPSERRRCRLLDAPQPAWIKPCLPTLVDAPPVGAEWVHEIKWDGYRVSAYIQDGQATIRTRNGHDWTTRFPAIVAGLSALKVRSAVIDGEAVVLDERGRSNFAALQADLERHAAKRAVLYAFDLIILDGEDLRTKPLEQRRLALATLIPKRSAVLMSDEYAGVGADLFRLACEHDLEGVVSKRRDAPYRSGRRGEWLKTKCVQSDTFVIIGYQPGSGTVRVPIANLKLATLDCALLRYAGAVGTGFSAMVAETLRSKLDRMRASRCAVPSLKVRGAVWVAPELRAEVAYRGLTATGELRQASFKGLVEEA